MAQGQNTAGVLSFLSGLFDNYANASTKPGFKKTEFWLTTGAAALSFVPAIGGPYGPIIGGVLTLAYTALRTYVTAKADANAAQVSSAAAVAIAPVAASEPQAAPAPVTATFPPGRM